MAARRNALLVASVALLGACGPREKDAAKYLGEQGYADVTIKKDGKTFTWTATKGDQYCTGTLAMTTGLGSSTQTNTSSCERDTRGCKPGAAAVCTAIADELYAKDAKVFPTKAAELYRIACEDKDARSCARVAEFEKIDKAWDKVRAFAKRSCELGSGEGCRHLAITESEGQGTEKNTAKGLELAKKACDLEDKRGCRALAGLLVDERRPEEALPIGEKLCAAKFEDGCFVLAVALFDVKKEFPRALGYLEEACKDTKLPARGYACNLAGAITLGALGMKKDSVRGIAFLEASCKEDYAEGCSNAARMYRSGANGVPKDKLKGDAFAVQACKLGKTELCDGN